MIVRGNAESLAELRLGLEGALRIINTSIQVIWKKLCALESIYRDDGYRDLQQNVMDVMHAMTQYLDDFSDFIEVLKEYEDVLRPEALSYANSGSCGNLTDVNQTTGNHANASHISINLTNTNVQNIHTIGKWVKEINPNYHNPFMPPGKNPHHVNCGSCAYAVESRFQGRSDAVAGIQNIGTDAGMEAVTKKKCVYMSVSDIEQKLISLGPGSHLICGINRHPTPFGQPQAGHWFNAYYDGNQIYTIDGQSGKIYDWPHDYGDVSEWCALI